MLPTQIKRPQPSHVVDQHKCTGLASQLIAELQKVTAISRLTALGGEKVGSQYFFNGRPVGTVRMQHKLNHSAQHAGLIIC